jgi:transcriptional regulator with XRE-family HTH domain
MVSASQASESVVADPPTEPVVAVDVPGPEVDAERTIRRVGGRIRRLRSRQGLKLQDVADRTGVSVSMLSMLERGVAGASIGTLVAVSSALGVHMSDLFEPGVDEPSPVRRRADQTQVETAAGVLRRLVHHAAAEGFEMVVNEYAPGTSSGPDAVHHPGREFGIVLEGTLVIELEDVRYEVGPGDAVTYASTRPHRISNKGRDTARAVWVNLSR